MSHREFCALLTGIVTGGAAVLLSQLLTLALP